MEWTRVAYSVCNLAADGQEESYVSAKACAEAERLLFWEYERLPARDLRGLGVGLRIFQAWRYDPDSLGFLRSRNCHCSLRKFHM
jgi:hypothetical protein